MKKIEDVFKDNLKSGMNLSSALKDAAKKVYGISYDLSLVTSKIYSAASKKKVKKKSKPRKRKRKPNWIRRDIRRPGKFRRFAEKWGLASKGESIPVWVKEKGCKSPSKTYKEITGKKIGKKFKREFQKKACLARTFMKFPAAHRGPAKKI